MNILVLVLSAVLGWPIGFNIGWLATNGRKGDPWNWRVCVGPGPYLNWLGERVPDWWRK